MLWSPTPYSCAACGVTVCVRVCAPAYFDAQLQVETCDVSMRINMSSWQPPQPRADLSLGNGSLWALDAGGQDPPTAPFVYQPQIAVPVGSPACALTASSWLDINTSGACPMGTRGCVNTPTEESGGGPALLALGLPRCAALAVRMVATLGESLPSRQQWAGPNTTLPMDASCHFYFLNWSAPFPVAGWPAPTGNAPPIVSDALPPLLLTPSLPVPPARGETLALACVSSRPELVRVDPSAWSSGAFSPMHVQGVFQSNRAAGSPSTVAIRCTLSSRALNATSISHYTSISVEMRVIMVPARWPFFDGAVVDGMDAGATVGPLLLMLRSNSSVQLRGAAWLAGGETGGEPFSGGTRVFVGGLSRPRGDDAGGLQSTMSFAAPPKEAACTGALQQAAVVCPEAPLRLTLQQPLILDGDGTTTFFNISCPPFCPHVASGPLDAPVWSSAEGQFLPSCVLNNTCHFAARGGGSIFISSGNCPAANFSSLASCQDYSAVADSVGRGVLPCPLLVRQNNTGWPVCEPCPDLASCPSADPYYALRALPRAGACAAVQPGGAVAIIACSGPDPLARCEGWDPIRGSMRCGAAFSAGTTCCMGCAAHHFPREGNCLPCPEGGFGVTVIQVLKFAGAVVLLALMIVGFALLLVRARGGGGVELARCLEHGLLLLCWLATAAQLQVAVVGAEDSGLPDFLTELYMGVRLVALDALGFNPRCLAAGVSVFFYEISTMAIGAALLAVAAVTARAGAAAPRPRAALPPSASLATSARRHLLTVLCLLYPFVCSCALRLLVCVERPVTLDVCVALNGGSAGDGAAHSECLGAAADDTSPWPLVTLSTLGSNDAVLCSDGALRALVPWAITMLLVYGVLFPLVCVSAGGWRMLTTTAASSDSFSRAAADKGAIGTVAEAFFAKPPPSQEKLQAPTSPPPQSAPLPRSSADLSSRIDTSIAVAADSALAFFARSELRPSAFWVRFGELFALLLLTAIDTAWRAPGSAGEMGGRLAVTLLVLGASAVMFHRTSPYRPHFVWLLRVKLAHILILVVMAFLAYALGLARLSASSGGKSAVLPLSALAFALTCAFLLIIAGLFCADVWTSAVPRQGTFAGVNPMFAPECRPEDDGAADASSRAEDPRPVAAVHSQPLASGAGVSGRFEGMNPMLGEHRRAGGAPPVVRRLSSSFFSGINPMMDAAREGRGSRNVEGGEPVAPAVGAARDKAPSTMGMGRLLRRASQRLGFAPRET